MNMYFDPLYWSRISRDDFDGDIMAVTKVAEPPKTVPRSYLTTHNPYMSRDWTHMFDERVAQKRGVLDCDVASLYPTFVPARGSTKVLACLEKMIEVEKMRKKYRDEMDAMRYCFNELNPMVKEKEKENMGLQADIHKTNGKAFIMVNGRKYPIQVLDLTIRSGEPLGITAYVEEVPSTYQMFVTMPRHAGCSEAMKFAQFAKEMLYGVDLSRHVPEIKDVKFEDPATIVFWADGTKTVVRAQDEAYDPEKGLAMAISRKALGNRRDYYHVFLKRLKKFRKKASTTLPLTDYERDILDDWEKQFAMEED